MNINCHGATKKMNSDLARFKVFFVPWKYLSNKFGEAGWSANYSSNLPCNLLYNLHVKLKTLSKEKFQIENLNIFLYLYTKLFVLMIEFPVCVI